MRPSTFLLLLLIKYTKEIIPIPLPVILEYGHVLPGEAGVGCPLIDGYSQEEGYSHSMEPASDYAPIDIIAPPFTDEVYALSIGKGEGIYGSSFRNTSPMFG